MSNIDTSPAALRKLADLLDYEYNTEHTVKLLLAIAAEKEAQQCACKDRAATECPGQWEPGCDLGNNEKHALASQPKPAPVLLTDDECREIDKFLPLSSIRAIESAVLRKNGLGV